METGRLSNLAKNIIPPPCFPFASAVRSPESFRRFEHQCSVSKKEKKKKREGKKGIDDVPLSSFAFFPFDAYSPCLRDETS